MPLNKETKPNLKIWVFSCQKINTLLCGRHNGYCQRRYQSLIPTTQGMGKIVGYTELLSEYLFMRITLSASPWIFWLYP